MKEKRGETRIGTAFIAKCADLTETDETSYIAINNLSYHGMQVLCDKKLPLGRNFKMDIDLIYGRIDAVVHVTWQNKIPHKKRYRVGLKFLEINRESERAIRNYIDTINFNAS